MAPSPSRSKMATVAPSAANRRAVAAPIPDAPPVMIPPRPSRSGTPRNLGGFRGPSAAEKSRDRAGSERGNPFGVDDAVRVMTGRDDLEDSDHLVMMFQRDCDHRATVERAAPDGLAPLECGMCRVGVEPEAARAEVAHRRQRC